MHTTNFYLTVPSCYIAESSWRANSVCTKCSDKYITIWNTCISTSYCTSSSNRQFTCQCELGAWPIPAWPSPFLCAPHHRKPTTGLHGTQGVPYSIYYFKETFLLFLLMLSFSTFLHVFKVTEQHTESIYINFFLIVVLTSSKKDTRCTYYSTSVTHILMAK